jgi:hypothetical protein
MKLEVYIAFIKALFLLALLLDLLIRLWLSMLELILNGPGAAGAFTWGVGLLFIICSFATLFPLVVPLLACVFAVVVLMTFLWPKSEAALLLSPLLDFLLKIFSVGGAIYFSLTWIGLAFTAAALSLGIMFAISAVGAILAFAALYVIGAEPGLLHSFITQVIGAGGAINWLLGFLALLTLGAGATFATPVLLAIPAVIVVLAAITWYFNKKDAVNTACLSCFSWQTTGQPQIKSKAGSLEESEILRPAVLKASL